MTVTPLNTSNSDSSGWETISLASRRRSLPAGGALRASKRKRNTCSALYAAGIECTEQLPQVEGARWCPRHNEERRKLYLNYKTYDALLREMGDVQGCSDTASIMSCDSLSLLREWNGHLRRKYNLLTRCIEARDYFTRRFFGEDMDFGHKAYWEGLKRERTEVDELISHVETRGHQLILQVQNAMWVLEQEAPDSGACSSHKDLQSPRCSEVLTQIRSTDCVEDATIEDHLEAALHRKAVESRQSLKMYLSWYCAPLTSRFHGERLEIVYAYVRRAIYKDASLMFLAHNYDNVVAFLSDEDLDLVTMEKLWSAVSSLCIGDTRSAVDDVMRSTDGDHVIVLGGKVFKSVSGEQWPLHIWGHVMAIHRCYTCVRRSCRTIGEIVDFTRYALLTGAPLNSASSHSHRHYSFPIEGSKELILAGFVADVSNKPPPPRHSIVSKELESGNIWEETKENLSAYAAMSLNDPMTQAFVNACFRHQDFIVMLRKGPNARVIRSSPVVWMSRKRSAPSRLALASAPWEDIAKLSDLELQEVIPYTWDQLCLVPIVDCMQVIIVETSGGTVSDFVGKLVQVWCRAYGVDSRQELYEVLKRPYEAAGELEAFQQVTGDMAIGNHQALWGCMPPTWVVESTKHEDFKF